MGKDKGTEQRSINLPLKFLQVIVWIVDVSKLLGFMNFRKRTDSRPSRKRLVVGSCMRGERPKIITSRSEKDFETPYRMEVKLWSGVLLEAHRLCAIRHAQLVSSQ